MTPKDFRSRRLSLGLNLAEMARLLAVPLRTIEQWERGEIEIPDPPALSAAMEHLERELAGRQLG